MSSGGGSEECRSQSPSLHTQAARVRRSGAAIFPDIDVAGLDGLALIGVEAPGQKSQDASGNAKKHKHGILGGADANALESGLLFVTRRHGDWRAKGGPDKRGGKEERTERGPDGVYVLVLNSRSLSGPGTRDKRFRPQALN